MTRPMAPSPLDMTWRQRSHLLFVWSDAQEGEHHAFADWYQGVYRQEIRTIAGVLTVRHYERHEVDITRGEYAPPPFPYLGILELSVDGAEAARDAIARIAALHREQSAAKRPATWLYHPAGEKVGRSPAVTPSLLTLAFANAVPGRELEFREWYITRHIRHALNIPALVSGQCFERALFQQPGAWDAAYSMIAVYEQEGTPESIIDSFSALPASTFDFPAMDISPERFAEWVYRPLADR